MPSLLHRLLRVEGGMSKGKRGKRKRKRHTKIRWLDNLQHQRDLIIPYDPLDTEQNVVGWSVSA